MWNNGDHPHFNVFLSCFLGHVKLIEFALNMVSVEILEAHNYGGNIGLVFPKRYAVVQVILQVLWFFVPLNAGVALKTHDMGFYFVYEFIVFNWISCVV